MNFYVRKKNILLYFILIFTFLSCKEKIVDGIEIGQDLYIGQSLEQNKTLSKLISKTLQKESKALSELIRFPCGGGAGCYDLGFVITQLVYRIGENDFIEMTKKIPEKEKRSLEGFLTVGFEYGNFTDKNIETEFPILSELLNI